MLRAKRRNGLLKSTAHQQTAERWAATRCRADNNTQYEIYIYIIKDYQ